MVPDDAGVALRVGRRAYLGEDPGQVHVPAHLGPLSASHEALAQQVGVEGALGVVGVVDRREDEAVGLDVAVVGPEDQPDSSDSGGGEQHRGEDGALHGHGVRRGWGRGGHR